MQKPSWPETIDEAMRDNPDFRDSRSAFYVFPLAEGLYSIGMRGQTPQIMSATDVAALYLNIHEALQK